MRYNHMQFYSAICLHPKSCLQVATRGRSIVSIDGVHVRNKFDINQLIITKIRTARTSWENRWRLVPCQVWRRRGSSGITNAITKVLPMRDDTISASRCKRTSARLPANPIGILVALRRFQARLSLWFAVLASTIKKGGNESSSFPSIVCVPESVTIECTRGLPHNRCTEPESGKACVSEGEASCPKTNWCVCQWAFRGFFFAVFFGN